MKLELVLLFLGLGLVKGFDRSAALTQLRASANRFFGTDETYGTAGGAVPRFLGKVSLDYAAFAELYDDFTDGSYNYTLYVSTFNPINFGRDRKYYLRTPGKYLDNVSGWKFNEIDQGRLTSYWPNNPDFMPSEATGSKGVIWTSGFLVPGKTKGALQLYNTSVDPPQGPVSITSLDTNEWSYHRAIWKDIDGDGDLDALTARFYKPIFGSTRTQLLWLENPGSSTAGGWMQHILQDSYTGSKELGPDVHFINLQLEVAGTTYDCIVAAEFWKEQLTLYYTSSGWTDWSKVGRVSIDTKLGQSFDVYVDDFNKDGKIDILATAYNHSMGNVFVYEIPEDFRSGIFVRHTLADGFKANFIFGGQSMTPGSPKPFYPSKAYEEEVLSDGRRRKPYIMVSGDDDGKHYVLEPRSTDARDWSYAKHLLVDTQKTTSGKFAIADLDGDGYKEVIAVGYSSNSLYVFTYKP